MSRRKIIPVWTCSDHVHHEHRWRWTAWLCGRVQALAHWWRSRGESPRQFTVKLEARDGQYHNFMSYGGMDRMLERARLIQRFDLGPENCVLVFEERAKP